MNAKIIDMNKEQISKEEAQEILKGLLEKQGEIDPVIGNFSDADSILNILSLPDKEFTVMSEICIEEMEKALNNPQDRLLLSQSLIATGLKAEDLVEEYTAILDELDKLTTEFPADRIGFLKRLMLIIINTISETEGIPKRTIAIPVQICNDNAKLPAYARVGDAGLDIYATEDISIAPGETKILPTGIKVAIPLVYELQVRPKSGRCAKTKLRVANTPGTIDSGYRDEIGVILENIEPKIKDIEYSFNEDGSVAIKSILHGDTYNISKGEKIAQLVLSEVPTVLWEEVNNIGEIAGDRGGGFGSTGIK